MQVTFTHPTTGKKHTVHIWGYYSRGISKFMQIGKRVYVKPTEKVPAQKLVDFLKKQALPVSGGHRMVKDVLPAFIKLAKTEMMPATEAQAAQYWRMRERMQARALAVWERDQARTNKKLAKAIADAKALLQRHGISTGTAISKSRPTARTGQVQERTLPLSAEERAGQ